MEMDDCYRGGWKCDLNGVQEALVEESLFYPIGTNLYDNLTYMYPQVNIWVIGHSLGGALASLLGIAYGVPVVAFESPGDEWHPVGCIRLNRWVIFLDLVELIFFS